MVKYTDQTLMPFGKYKREALVNVPAEYLLWCYREMNLQAPLRDYIKDNLQVLEMQAKNSRKFNSR